MKKGKNNTWNYVFALTAFALAGLLAFYPSSNDSSNKDNSNDSGVMDYYLSKDNPLEETDFAKTDSELENNILTKIVIYLSLNCLASFRECLI